MNLTASNWPDVVISLVPVLLLVMQYLLGKKVDQNTRITNETKVMVNSGSQIQMELMVTTLNELLLAKPDDVSVIARLGAADKMLQDHKTKQAIVDNKASNA